MPKKPDVQQEGRILQAINAIKNNEIASIRHAARVFEVPRSTLTDRLHGHFEIGTAFNKSFKMTQLEEESLEK